MSAAVEDNIAGPGALPERRPERDNRTERRPGRDNRTERRPERDDRTERRPERDDHRQVLQVVQPALAGMMDGSVSTLAPLFATALATRDSHTAFLVGVAAAVGAGISMAFAEALSDDGSVTGRGNAWVRGLVEGSATLAGGLGHTLPFLLSDVRVALPVASIVVVIELLVISWLRYHYFRMPLVRSALQVILGGALVFGAGVLIGSS